ncbi:hypothetical protein NQ317_012729 [Molorchus minor]|uniref:Uncharacterized protein n=1 Tax=Molorchus minor TaxID=1323400 RepID=A0ABQ9JMT9_9CUCU|nr:hypothetical protein NQ317_012729 [Molorchus minor]
MDNLQYYDDIPKSHFARVEVNPSFRRTTLSDDINVVGLQSATVQTGDWVIQTRPALPENEVQIETRPLPVPEVEIETRPLPLPTPEIETQPIPTPEVEIETRPLPIPEVEIGTRPLPLPTPEIETQPPTPEVEVETRPLPLPNFQKSRPGHFLFQYFQKSKLDHSLSQRAMMNLPCRSTHSPCKSM